MIPTSELALELLLGAGIIALLLLDLFSPQRVKGHFGYVAAAVFAGVLVASFFIGAQAGAWALFFKRALLVAGALGSLAAVDLLRRTSPRRQGEYYLLLMFSVLGMMLVPGAKDLVLLIVAFELMGVPLYLMAAYGKTDGAPTSAEAGLKLFFTGAASSTLVMFGAALLYGAAGSTQLADIATAEKTPLLMLGGVLLLGGMAFKVGAAPFHMWVPDTYQGAQAPFVAFLSVAPKLAGVAALGSVFLRALPAQREGWLPAIAGLAVASLLVGNVMALPQTSARRLLAFSGVAQLGYVLLGFAAGTLDATAMVLFYLASYLATNLGAFLVVHTVSTAEGSDELACFDGLAQRAPLLAGALLLLLLSLAGIPFVVGFWAKLYVFAAVLQAGMAWAVVLGAVLAVVALFYYLRLIRAMYLSEPRSRSRVVVAPATGIAIFASVAVAVGAGLYPRPLVDAAEQAARAFFFAG